MPEALDRTPLAEVRKDVAPIRWVGDSPAPMLTTQSVHRVRPGLLRSAGGIRLLEAAGSAAKERSIGRPVSLHAPLFPTLVVILLAAALCPHLVVAQTAGGICDSCVESKDIKNNSIKSVDIKNGQVKKADLAKNSVNSQKIVDLKRTLSFPARALTYQTSSNIVTPSTNGLRWKQNFSGNARLTCLKPSDYAGGDATLRIFFYTTTATAGAVDFFIRPDSFDPGEALTDIASTGAPAVLVSGKTAFGNLYEQSFVVPKRRIQKDWWTINIQRNGNESSYTDDVIVMAVALDYQAVQ